MVGAGVGSTIGAGAGIGSTIGAGGDVGSITGSIGAIVVDPSVVTGVVDSVESLEGVGDEDVGVMSVVMVSFVGGVTDGVRSFPVAFSIFVGLSATVCTNVVARKIAAPSTICTSLGL